MNLAIVGRRIQECRVRKRMSQLELAEAAELSAFHVGAIENGKKGLSLDALVKIADVLDVPTDRLLTGYKQNNLAPYINDISALLAECSPYERNVLLKVMFATRSALCESKLLFPDNCGEE